MKSKFYCDINGTFDKGINRNESLNLFVEQLKNIDDSEELSFSFVSSENMEVIKLYMEELLPYINNSKITF